MEAFPQLTLNWEAPFSVMTLTLVKWTHKHTGQYLMVFIAVVHIFNNNPFLTLCSHVYRLASLLWSCVQHELSPHSLLIDTIHAVKYWELKKFLLIFFYTAFSWPFSLIRGSKDVSFLCCPGFVYAMIFDVDFYILSDDYFLPD